MAMLVIDGVTMPTPSKYEWSIQDVSIGESGRDDTGYMYKGRVTSKVKLVLEWAGKDPVSCKAILEAVQPEYIMVTYFDSLKGEMTEKQFYTGDRHTKTKIWSENNKIFETISLDIIER